MNARFSTTYQAQAFLTVVVCAIGVGCRQSQTRHGIDIEGSERFASQIQAALSLIRDKAPEEFASISTYIRRIEESDRSGMDAGRSTCQLAPATAYHSLTWCAGAIVHESHHAKLARSASYSYGHAEEELACIKYQMAVMEKLGAPRSELDYLASLDGKHFDADGDGEYTWEDYRSRDW